MDCSAEAFLLANLCNADVSLNEGTATVSAANSAALGRALEVEGQKNLSFSQKMALTASKYQRPPSTSTLSKACAEEVSCMTDFHPASQDNIDENLLSSQPVSSTCSEMELSASSSAKLRCFSSLNGISTGLGVKRLHSELQLSQSTESASSAVNENGTTEVEPYSGLGIRSRFIGKGDVTALLRCISMGLVRLSELSSKMSKLLSLQQNSQQDRRTDHGSTWAIMGVVVSKTKTKITEKGDRFIVFKISDMDSTVATLFLYSSAFQDYMSVEVGTILLVVHPKILDSTNAITHTSVTQREYSFTVNNSEQIRKIGISTDLSYCPATKKNGDRCGVPVSKKRGGFCPYHIKAAYFEMNSRRCDLLGSPHIVGGPPVAASVSKAETCINPYAKQGSGSSERMLECSAAVAPVGVRQILKIQKEQKEKEDASRSRISALKGTKGNLKPTMQTSSISQTSVSPSASELKTKIAGLRSEMAAAAAAMEFEKAAKLRDQMIQLHKHQQELAAHNITGSSALPKGKVSQQKPGGTEENRSNSFPSPSLFRAEFSAADLLLRREMSKRSEKPIFPISSPASPAPRLLKPTQGDSTSLTLPPTASLTPRNPNLSARPNHQPSQDVEVKKHPAVNQPIPGSSTDRNSKAKDAKVKFCVQPRHRIQVLDSIQIPSQQPCSCSSSSSSSTPVLASGAKGRTIGAALSASLSAISKGLDSNGSASNLFDTTKKSDAGEPSELEAVLAASRQITSIHANDVEAKQACDTSKVLGFLEQKEVLGAELNKIMEEKVPGFYCKECDRIFEAPQGFCQQKHHTITKLQGVTKRFFECKTCHRRCYELGVLYPRFPCTLCGGHHFARVSLFQDVKGPELRPPMLPRGIEMGTSLRGDLTCIYSDD